MKNCIKETEKTLTELREICKSVRKQLRRKIPGKLMIANTAKGRYFYQVLYVGSPKKRRKLKGISRNPETIYALANQAYREELLRRAEANVKLFAKFHKQIIPMETDDILRALPPNYKYLNEAWIVNPSLRTRESRLNPIGDGSLRPVILQTKIESSSIPGWGALPYCENTAFKENKKHITESGYYVRSKSEGSLLEIYFKKEIAMHYDELVKMGSVYISPDFIVLKPDGSIIIHEHLGRMDLEEYRDRMYEKLEIYRANGFILGKNLLLTFDDEFGNINLQLISSLIDDMYNR